MRGRTNGIEHLAPWPDDVLDDRLAIDCVGDRPPHADILEFGCRATLEHVHLQKDHPHGRRADHRERRHGLELFGLVVRHAHDQVLAAGHDLGELGLAIRDDPDHDFADLGLGLGRILEVIRIALKRD